MTLQTTQCPKCKGTGTVLDRMKVGSAMRSERKAAGVSLRRVAGMLGKSAAYLSELELGRNRWTDSLVRVYRTAVERAVAEASEAKR